VDAAAYLDPTLLLNAQPPGAAPNVTSNVSGNLLSLTAPANFGGTFKVTVTASDGTDSVSRSFVVSGRNQAPQLAAIADQHMSRNQDTLQLTLQAPDSDGDAATYYATLQPYSGLYALDQELSLVRQNGNYFENWLRQGEKWVFSQAQNQWYFVTPTGTLYHWTGGTFEQSLLPSRRNRRRL
jgi:hypothetical protein